MWKFLWVASISIQILLISFSCFISIYLFVLSSNQRSLSSSWLFKSSNICFLHRLSEESQLYFTSFSIRFTLFFIMGISTIIPLPSASAFETSTLSPATDTTMQSQCLLKNSITSAGVRKQKLGLWAMKSQSMIWQQS